MTWRSTAAIWIVALALFYALAKQAHGFSPSLPCHTKSGIAAYFKSGGDGTILKGEA